MAALARKAAMTPLADLLLRRIRTDGPMSLAAYMTECLLHPEHGYYTTRPPFGREGDFITSPEISQMFGELIGLALAQSWLDQGAPARFTLAEYGPGRGTLMADILRATRAVPGFHQAAKITLLEASPALRATQAKALAGHRPSWIDAPEDLSDQPLWLVANEFFDALPIHQFLRQATGWHEKLVGASDAGLCFGLSAPLPAERFDPRFAADPPGTVVELCPAALPPIRAAASRICQHGGLALIVDYGGWRSKGDTLQALRAHAFADLLAAPGEADITAHVDFEALALAAGLAHLYTPQGQFLKALGIDERTSALAARLSGAPLKNHLAAAERLTSPADMGDLFKVLALYPQSAPRHPGFA
jgi:NADH dehydrogenase [ubiquinone] 1 alpha subcomplex assembly factor 7